MNNYEQPDNTLKIILMGENNCGITSIQNRYVNDTFDENILTSTESEFNIKTIEKNGKIIKLNIWTIKGSQRYCSIYSRHIQDANGCFFVFDLDHRNSFESLDFWIDFFEREETNAIKFIIGNKKDRKEEIKWYDREINEYEIEEKVKSKGMKYFECSAKTGEGIDKIFSIMIEEILKDERIMENVKNKQQEQNKKYFNIF